MIHRLYAQVMEGVDAEGPVPPGRKEVRRQSIDLPSVSSTSKESWATSSLRQLLVKENELVDLPGRSRSQTSAIQMRIFVIQMAKRTTASRKLLPHQKQISAAMIPANGYQAQTYRRAKRNERRSNSPLLRCFPGLHSSTFHLHIFLLQAIIDYILLRRVCI